MDRWVDRGACLHTLVILSLLYTVGVDLEETEKDIFSSLTMDKR